MNTLKIKISARIKPTIHAECLKVQNLADDEVFYRTTGNNITLKECSLN